MLTQPAPPPEWDYCQSLQNSAADLELAISSCVIVEFTGMVTYTFKNNYACLVARNMKMYSSCCNVKPEHVHRAGVNIVVRRARSLWFKFQFSHEFTK